ncbi:hypothetical protein RhiXN_06076 [Rhizoctonia solani]|uniref:Uncharacterized protein n=1 Tax=Rhizoctonia solani TaxID=456999 RepID=A0A8H8SY03_9AGAM|nr:uncharacterized protein RhiXN_06076 [Rhizoctonia solani]QRW21087.1 hypothetical protein RhiXN_06076 [Rhizoctonia solani]
MRSRAKGEAVDHRSTAPASPLLRLRTPDSNLFLFCHAFDISEHALVQPGKYHALLSTRGNVHASDWEVDEDRSPPPKLESRCEVVRLRDWEVVFCEKREASADHWVQAGGVGK